MALGPRLDLRQSQSLVMTPQLQQALKLLALSNIEVDAYIGETLEANPLLDVKPADGGDDGDGLGRDGLAGGVADGLGAEDGQRESSSETTSVDRLIGEGRGSEDRPLDLDGAALDRDYDTGDGALRGNGARGDGAWGAEWRSGGGLDGPGIEEQAASDSTLREHLDAQVGMASRDPYLVELARSIIGELDDAGYLPTKLSELAQDLDVPESDMEAALRVVQSLEPTGVGARTLSECIALQAQEADRYDPLMAKFIAHLDLLGKGERSRLKRLCGADEEDFADMIAEVRSYDPKPGLRFGGVDPTAITPDILITAREDGGWNIALNPATLPRLIVNRAYYVELKGGVQDKQARGWLSEKLTDANWLIKALDQRQKTILKVAAEMVKQQDGFFRHGVAQLKPMTLRMVADAIGLHESTVSRVRSHKFLSCPLGTYELKYFFTSGVASADGEGGASAEAVKAAIRQLIDAESPDAILSDDALVVLLKDKGYALARRTVAKYREAIGLGSSVQRRRQKSLALLR